MSTPTVPPASVARPVAPDSAGARRLIALSDAYLCSLYPPESTYLASIETLLAPNVCFLGIESGEELVACGAVILQNHDVAYGEIKRVFVLPDHRGKGHARRIMDALENELRERQIGIVRLETGVSQPEALQLYRSLGYALRGPFGNYRLDPLSVYMEKAITPCH